MIIRPILALTALTLFAPLGAAAAGPVALDDFGVTCVDTSLSDCKVLSAGYLNVDDMNDEARTGSPLLAWQTQAGVSVEAGTVGGVVLFQHADDGWTTFGSGFEAYRYELPTLNEEGVLHVAGYSSGTGSFNADLLFQPTDDGGWQQIDMDTWLGNVSDMLPAGLEIWKGVRYDFAAAWSGYTASTSLWSEDDANCCPTGGSAVITLEIVDNALVATKVDYTPPEKAK